MAVNFKNSGSVKVFKSPVKTRDVTASRPGSPTLIRLLPKLLRVDKGCGSPLKLSHAAGFTSTQPAPSPTQEGFEKDSDET